MAGKYKATKGENGKYRIERVPIFKLGEIRGFLYNRQWSERMLGNMRMREEGGFYPPVIVGHNGFGSELKEKEAIGFMTNFSTEYAGEDPDIPMGTVYCDFMDIGEERMQEIRDMKYPYRSVEVWNDRAEFSAVALLGGTEPYFKFPRLEVFSQEPGKVVHHYKVDDSNGEAVFQEIPACPPQQPTSCLLGTLVAGMTAVGDGSDAGGRVSILKEFVAELKRYFTGPKIEVNNEEEEGKDMDAEKFKETYGMTQEEAANLAQATATAQAEVEKLRADVRRAESGVFAEKLRGMNVAPAVIEKLQEKFEKADDPEGAVSAYMEVITAARDGNLFVPAGESGQHSEKRETVDPDDSAALHEAIVRYQEEHKCDYQAAAKAVFQMVDKQREGK